jgi:hypothetical protein
MNKSKCTCQHRRLAHVRNRLVEHEESCYYFAKLKEEDQARAELESVKRLYSHYRRQARKQ